MASIRQLPSGLWHARVRRQGHQAASMSFRLRVDAEAWARKVEGEQERGTWRDGAEAERTTLRDALDRYGREVTPRKRGVDQEMSTLRTLSGERIADQALARIGSHDIASLRDRWRREGLSAGTIRRRMTTLKHVYTVARREWGMPGLGNPVLDVTLDPENNARSRRVSQAELEAICTATGSAELAAFIRLAVETACRRGELCALQWEHVDLKARTAHLPQTKNGTSRDVPLSTRAVDVLRALPRRLDGRVFGLRPDSVSQAFARAAGRAGIEGVHFHDLRHEATSRLAAVLSVHELAKVTGHLDMRMLLRYYHPRASDLAEKLG